MVNNKCLIAEHGFRWLNVVFIQSAGDSLLDFCRAFIIASLLMKN